NWWSRLFGTLILQLLGLLLGSFLASRAHWGSYHQQDGLRVVENGPGLLVYRLVPASSEWHF
ncbi:hypothetical protein FOTG_19038, partial [Fusarium oxysporum f. sp. vasinfectum 25433]